MVYLYLTQINKYIIGLDMPQAPQQIVKKLKKEKEKAKTIGQKALWAPKKEETIYNVVILIICSTTHVQITKIKKIITLEFTPKDPIQKGTVDMNRF